jgi:hypothetical protein
MNNRMVILYLYAGFGKEIPFPHISSSFVGRL